MLCRAETSKMGPQRAIFGALLASKLAEKEGGNPRFRIELLPTRREDASRQPRGA